MAAADNSWDVKGLKRTKGWPTRGSFIFMEYHFILFELFLEFFFCALLECKFNQR